MRKFDAKEAIDDKSALVQVMVWCRKTTSHYSNQWALAKISDAIWRH